MNENFTVSELEAKITELKSQVYKKEITLSIWGQEIIRDKTILLCEKVLELRHLQEAVKKRDEEVFKRIVEMLKSKEFTDWKIDMEMNHYDYPGDVADWLRDNKERILK